MPATATQPTSSGLDQNLAGLLSYLLGIITGIIFFAIEKENRFVRFHAMQSIIFGAAMFVFWIAFTVLGGILAVIPLIGWLISALLGLVFGVGFFVLWIVLMVKAFQGEEWELPVIGKYARQYAGTVAV
ncbi:MAG TPA: DUF4870 domain-containing protein [Gemmatimonadaceae bacterium]|nr:DUF4870 domain-containing protein [Gemmatimonadaceae bacterium]